MKSGSVAKLQVDYCPSCGKVYQINARALCPSCAAQLDSDWKSCEQYLKHNRTATPEHVSRATNVPLKQINLLITKGWLSLPDYPNLSYPCQSCGSPIKNDKICAHCKVRLRTDIERVLAHEQDSMSRNRSGVYFKNHSV